MRLKSLKLAGFKSFANPTTFLFKHKITAIVGPNGCGKSNVIDAIRWVLGETSAKQLRGGAMRDVIFAGTQDKAAKSMASVELTFEHTQDEATGIRHELNLYHELSVRRQVSSDGRSDYFINGTRCRRRDVVDVFLGTGLGSRSYAVIEQGMIGRIIDSSPMQLREFIEEAAGVSRYQARREETQKKLQQSCDNLQRLVDIEQELLKQQKNLSKQAQSAEQYAELKVQLASIDERLAVEQLYNAKHAQQQQSHAHTQLANKIDAARQDYEQQKSKLDKLNQQIAEEQWLKDDAREQLHQQQLAEQQYQHQLEQAHQASIQAEQLRQQLQIQQQQLDEDIATCSLKLAQQQQKLQQQQPQLSRLQDEHEQLQAKRQQQQASWRDEQQRLQGLQQEEQRLKLQHSSGDQQLARLQHDEQKWQQRQQRLQQRSEELLVQLAVQLPNHQSDIHPASHYDDHSERPFDHAQDPVQQSLQRLSEQLSEQRRHGQQRLAQQQLLEDDLQEAQAQYSHSQNQLSQQQQQHSEQEKQYAIYSSEYDTLHRLLHPPQSQIPAVDALTKPTVDGERASVNAELTQLGTLRDKIELTPMGEAYAHSLDKWLAMWLDSRIVSVVQDATASTLGQPSQPILNKLLEQTHQQTAQPQSPSIQSLWLEQSQPLAARDTRATKVDSQLLPLSQLIAKPNLRLWQSLYLYVGDEAYKDDATTRPDSRTDDSRLATDTCAWAALAQLDAGSLLLTQSGWLISHVGCVHLSKLLGETSVDAQFLSQRLAQQQRLSELDAILDALQEQMDISTGELKRQQQQCEQQRIHIEELQAHLKSSTQQHQQQQQQLAQSKTQLESWHVQAQHLSDERQQLIQDRDERQQQLQQLQAEQQQILSELAQLQPQLQTANHDSQQQQLAYEQAQQDAQLIQQQWQAMSLEVQQMQLTYEHQQQQQQSLQQQQQTVQHRYQAACQRHADSQAQLPQLNAAYHQSQHDSQKQHSQVDAYQERISQLQQQQHSQAQQLEAQLSQLDTDKAQLAQLATQVAVADERIAEASSRLQTLKPEVSPSSLLAEFIAHGRRLSPEKMDALLSQQKDLKSKLDKIGAVNLAAIDELAQINARLQPLAEQINDIRASMTTLEDAIVRIDNKTKDLFMQTLTAVNQAMAALFAKVFGGGEAELNLLPDDSLNKADKWRAGLELMAQPKGKKNSRLAVLSGGEKTLTALSLIFAIFKQHPAPFCVLDEVDAPLDDANVARFASLIAELSQDVQFIFISHNKLSMQTADELKGITMPSAGISQLVSVDLQEAEQYIAS